MQYEFMLDLFFLLDITFATVDLFESFTSWHAKGRATGNNLQGHSYSYCPCEASPA